MKTTQYITIQARTKVTYYGEAPDNDEKYLIEQDSDIIYLSKEAIEILAEFIKETTKED